MAELSRMTLPIDAGSVLLMATGGTARTKVAYENGVRTESNVQRAGVDVHRLTGMAVSVGGQGLDGATVETSTPLEDVPAGGIFRAEGVAEVSVRAEGKSGFNGNGPRGVLALTVFVERLVPVGNANDLLRAASGSRKTASGDAA